MAEHTTSDTDKPILDAEVANRLLDPFEVNYLGVLRSNDPLLLERGGDGSSAWDIYRDLVRDGKVFAGLQKRKLAVIGRPWQVEPVGDGGMDDAQIVTAMLKRMNFDAACSDLMDALLYGFVPAEIIWTVRDGLIAPQRLIAHRQRRFVYVQDDPDTPPQLRMLVQGEMIRGVALPQRKFIAHRINPDDGNPYGTGLGLQLYWPVYFKRKGVVSWNKLNDRFGCPTVKGTYPQGADKKAQQTLFEAMRALSNDGTIMFPEGMNVDLLESRLTGNITTQQSLVEYMDDWIAEVLLGQSPRGAGGGALAAARVEREQVRIELSQADSDLLSETLNNTLIKWICEFNGLAPCMVYRVVKKDEDLKVASETDVNVQSLGFRLTLDGVRAKYGEYWEAAPDNVKVKRAAGDPNAGANAGINTEMPSASFAEGNPAPPDAIDQLVSSELAQWRDVVEPLAAPLRALLKQAAAQGLTAGELLARLPDLLAQMDDGPLAQSLTGLAYTSPAGGQWRGREDRQCLITPHLSMTV
jgi:phage gp29-like protein